MKKFTIKVISIVLSAIFIVCAYNYHFDRYGIYNPNCNNKLNTRRTFMQ